MAKREVNVGCGLAVLIFIGLMIFAAALNYAGSHMDGLTSFIVGTIIVALVVIIMVRGK